MNEVAPRRLLPRLIHGSECKGHAELRVSHTSREVFHLTLLVCANEKFRTNPFSSQLRSRSQSLRVLTLALETVLATTCSQCAFTPSPPVISPNGSGTDWERSRPGGELQPLRQRGLSRCEPGFRLRDPDAIRLPSLPLAL